MQPTENMAVGHQDGRRGVIASYRRETSEEGSVTDGKREDPMGYAL